MPVPIVVPSVGESVSEVRIGEWRKPVGSFVALDEVVVEIETDKAAMELPAPVAGELVKVLLKEGADAVPGDRIGLIEPSDYPPESGSSDRSGEADSDPPAEPRVMPAARRVLSQAGLPASAAKPTGPGGRVLREDAVRAAEEAAAPPPPATAAVPSVSREGRQSRPGPEPPSPGPDPQDAAGRLAGARDEEAVRMTPLRKVIARNLVRAQQEAALLTTFNEVDMTEVIRIRRTYREAFQQRHGIKLGFMSFFVRAAVAALRAVPAVNARIEGETIIYRKYQDIGIAVGGGKGLVVPVLRNTETMGFAEIERSVADFAKRARENKIDISELRGGTFTISNGGIYGSMLSTPIVNPPQSGILGMHAIQDRPVAVEGRVEVRPMMYLALTYDHRLVDGREAVTFLKRVKDLVEQPERIWLQV